MIAPGGVQIPRLVGIPVSHRLFAGEKMAATVAMTLVNAGVADPADWKPRASPSDFMQAGIDGFIQRHGGAEIRKQFDLYAGLSSTLNRYGEGGAGAAKRLFLMVEPQAAGFMVMGPTIALLERIDRRLASWFYGAVMGALNRWVRVYDYHDALERRLMMEEYYDCDPDDEKPELPDVEACIPPSIKTRALSSAAVSRLNLVGRVRRIVNAAAALAAIRQPKNMEPITDEERGAFMDSNPPLPSLLAVFGKHDMIEAAFDDEAQGMNEVEPEPSVLIPFDGTDVKSCKRAFGAFRAMCETLASASGLIGMMPGNVEDIQTGERQ